MANLSAQTTAEEALGEVSLVGKVALVTGAASGLGEETCRVLAMAGAQVLMAGRDQAALEAARDRIQARHTDAVLTLCEFDLASLESLRSRVPAIVASTPKIDLLINNAGVMASPMLRTADGFELQFGTNHLGHFALTLLLLPALRAAKGCRVVNLSSGGHKFGKVDFDDPNYHKRDYDKWQAYGQSKTANMLFSVGLGQRFAAAGIASNAVHPGAIMTNLGRHMDESDFATIGDNMEKGGMTFKSIEQGAATSVWAATSPALEGKTGLYLEDCGIAAEVPEGQMGGGYNAYGLDAESARRLWALSEELTGIRAD